MASSIGTATQSFEGLSKAEIARKAAEPVGEIYRIAVQASMNSSIPNLEELPKVQALVSEIIEAVVKETTGWYAKQYESKLETAELKQVCRLQCSPAARKADRITFSIIYKQDWKRTPCRERSPSETVKTREFVREYLDHYAKLQTGNGKSMFDSNRAAIEKAITSELSGEEAQSLAEYIQTPLAQKLAGFNLSDAFQPTLKRVVSQQAVILQQKLMTL